MSAEAQSEAAAEVISGIAPYLTLRDAAAAAELYKQMFAAREVGRHAGEDGKRLVHCHLYLNGASLMLMDAFPEHGAPLEPAQGYMLHLQVDDARAWWDRAIAADKVEITMPLDVQFWGDRFGSFRDSFGVAWSIGGKP